MRLIKQVTIAIAAVSMLEEERLTIPVKTMSSELGVSYEFLTQIMLKLKKSSLITSVRGPGGGYKISKEVDKDVGISVIDVLTALEQSLDTEKLNTTYFSEEKAAEINSAVSQALGKVMISRFSEKSIRKELDQYKTVVWN